MSRTAEPPKGTLDSVEHRALMKKRWPSSDCVTRSVQPGARQRAPDTGFILPDDSGSSSIWPQHTEYIKTRKEMA